MSYEIKVDLCILAAFIGVVSCKRYIKINDYYSGIVVAELGIPQDSVLVKTDYPSPYAKQVYTGKEGYFKIKKVFGRINFFQAELLIRHGSHTKKHIWRALGFF